MPGSQETNAMIVNRDAMDRRRFMASLSAVGLGGTVIPALLWSKVRQSGKITIDMLDEAEALSGLRFTEQERELMLDGVNQNLERYQKLRTVEFPNSIHPAIRFDPVLPGHAVPTEQRAFRYSRPTRVARPSSLTDLAYARVVELAELVRTRQVSSVELTRMYLERLERHNPSLECVVTLTSDLAIKQARRADEELARGHYRGPLHGIPWGAKDLLAEDSYRTTWGAKPFEQQHIFEDATVVRRLEDAGAVLVAKLTLGALAWGDVWFGGRTRNPWNLEQGSSGSSAGSAAATVAGLVGFSIGSETLGSIVSPSTRCGATGLRPTYGRVSRHGAMALCWTMDKLGPICRGVEDCALVLNAIHGADGKDPTARSVPFNWDAGIDITSLRVGFFERGFDEERPEDQSEQARMDEDTLRVLRGLGVDPIPIDLPSDLPLDAMRIILDAEAATAFDELTRSNRDDELVRQIKRAWPNLFRHSRFIPAVEYIQANRLRTIAMGAFAARMDAIDVLVTPSYGGDILLLTNLTGHPAAVVPNGFTESGAPGSISFIGKLYGEAEALAVAKAYQDATNFHLARPPRFA